uniref:Uncharacterized protein n=2 Tax=Parascaris univalens TaxID=6257 RepID=A0A915BCZ1_PARUN
MMINRSLIFLCYRRLNTVVLNHSRSILSFRGRFQLASCLHSSGVNDIRVKSSQGSGSSKNVENEAEGEEDKEESSQPRSPFNDPNLMRRLRIYMLIVGGCTFIVSYFALKPFFTNQFSNIASDLNSTPIEMDEFLKIYIPSGEVKRIVHFPNQGRAVAWLHDGAVINGKPANHSIVVIKYDRREGRPVEHFHAEIRAREKELGIQLRNGVQIEDYFGFTSLKLVELLIGLAILAFLGSQYSRLIAARIAQKKAKGG